MMKLWKTYILVLIIIIILVIKFVPFSSKIKNPIDEGVINLDISDSQKDYTLKIKDGLYYVNFTYLVLYDDSSIGLVEELREDYLTRLELFEKSIYDASLGKIIFNSNLEFKHVNILGMDELVYNEDLFHNINTLYSIYYDTADVVAFVPIYETTWCSDGLSQGFNHNGKIFFCMEAYFNPKNSIENKGAVGLMMHKFLHGVGFNHQDQMFEQYTLLNFYSGLPETNIFLHGNYKEFENYYLDEYSMKILGLVDREEFEDKCLDLEGFVCKPSNGYFCKDSWGSFCQDVDKDGILDERDIYVFSSPKKGIDTDNDGIVDSLDLCDWNSINVFVEEKKTNIPLRIKIGYNQKRISFQSNNKITKVAKIPSIMIGGLIKFDEDQRISSNNSEIEINSNTPLWKIEVYYKYEGKEYIRPYFVTFPNINADFVYEREWYYFNRFGCDRTSNVDFGDINTYDVDLNGIPDKNLFLWSNKINNSYDWDQDNFSDLEDTLPTVQGFCKDKFVQGVKDSDEDGFCNPGIFQFQNNDRVEDYEFFMKSNINSNSDMCPYISGSINGCFIDNKT